MTEYKKIDTLAHIKRIDVVGIDPLTENIIIEVYAGPQHSDAIKDFGCFSVTRDALEQLHHQTADALEAEETPAHA